MAEVEGVFQSTSVRLRRRRDYDFELNEWKIVQRSRPVRDENLTLVYLAAFTLKTSCFYFEGGFLGNERFFCHA